MSVLSICGIEIAPGETKNVVLKVSETFLSEPIHIPVSVIRGRKPGPTAFVFAAVHGNEIAGVDIVRRLIYEVNHTELRGTLIAVPVVNVQGFHAQSRYLPYYRDLNRFFPGKKAGNNAHQIAYTLFNEIIRHCDFGVDLHTAGEGRLNLPQVRADLKNAKVRKIARATGCKILMDHRGSKGTLRRAATDVGVPTILFEAGEPGRFDPNISKEVLNNLLNLFHRMKMYPTDRKHKIPFKPRFQIIVRKHHWVRAHEGGILVLKVKPGQLVYAGDDAGSIVSPYGKIKRKIAVPFTGIVIGITVQPLAAPGTGLIHMVRVKKSLRLIEKHAR